MTKKLLSFFFAYCLLPVAYCFSQDYPDAGSWNTLNIDKAINGKLTALFTEECRFKENFSRLNLFYTNLGIEYKVAKNFKVALIYRWIDKFQDDNSYSFRHRLMLDLTFKQKFGKLTASYRNRTQVEDRDIYSSDNGSVPEWYSRNKFGAKYDMGKRYIPFASVELRYQFRDPRNIESDKTWHRERYVLGAEYKINNKNIFSAYYLIQREHNVLSPQNLYIVGLEYSLSL
ncbi:MAG: DUF2490 domain-containing protein [Bacteroidetes bacterium]|nr:DUF2490 domain-containing protein [Bacteroidota bacterium]